MPFLNRELLEWLIGLSSDVDVVMPTIDGQMDPMHAVYRREPCLEAIDRALRNGQKRMIAYLGDVRVREVTESELRTHDPELRSFFNINTPEDLAEAQRLAAPDRAS
jgi:molybdopterin-guanine dinucleotide biosynthesis protein A